VNNKDKVRNKGVKTLSTLNNTCKIKEKENKRSIRKVKIL